jgi:hypothetical protein
MNNTHTQQVQRTIRKWTQEEEMIVLNNVKSFPDNLQEAFRVSQRQIERGFHTIQNKYYTTLRQKYPNVISVGTSKGFSVKNTKNRANTSEEQDTPLTPILRPVHRIVMEMMQLSPEDLQKIVDFFK